MKAKSFFCKIVIAIMVLAVSLAVLFTLVILMGEYVMPAIEDTIMRIVIGCTVILTVILDVTITVEYNMMVVLSRSAIGRIAFDGDTYQFKPFVLVWYTIFRNLRNA